jgi:hypothetical protein
MGSCKVLVLINGAVESLLSLQEGQEVIGEAHGEIGATAFQSGLAGGRFSLVGVVHGLEAVCMVRNNKLA